MALICSFHEPCQSDPCDRGWRVKKDKCCGFEGKMVIGHKSYFNG